jgi:hypothetical protein
MAADAVRPFVLDQALFASMGEAFSTVKVNKVLLSSEHSLNKNDEEDIKFLLVD